MLRMREDDSSNYWHRTQPEPKLGSSRIRVESKTLKKFKGCMITILKGNRSWWPTGLRALIPVGYFLSGRIVEAPLGVNVKCQIFFKFILHSTRYETVALRSLIWFGGVREVTANLCALASKTLRRDRSTFSIRTHHSTAIRSGILIWWRSGSCIFTMSIHV